jgi:uncharacterized membrane protein YhaH (DUF805 family)
MSLGDILFSFSGRINRAKYWLASLIPLVLVGVVLALPFARLPKAATVFLAVSLGIIVLAMALALGVKRLHDRNKSAWWLVIFYVLPVAFDFANQTVHRGDPSFLLTVMSAGLSLWAIVELGFIRGTNGSNQFGPDPLQPTVNFRYSTR